MDDLEEQEIYVLLLVLPLSQRVIWDKPLYLVYPSVRWLLSGAGTGVPVPSVVQGQVSLSLLWCRDRTVLGVWFLCTKALGLDWGLFFLSFFSFFNSSFSGMELY